MEEKTDKVVGYIEYLGAGGMIGEIVPYTSVEKFKDEILDSLDCGRPVTPVVFSDELDEPLQFDSDTYFPWGFRSEKRVQIPYEIYQTNRRDLVFMEYSPARLAAGAKDYELVYKGQMERWETLDSISNAQMTKGCSKMNFSWCTRPSVGGISSIKRKLG